MEIMFTSNKGFEEFFEGIAKLTDSIALQFKEDGLEVSMITPSHVMFVSAVFEKDFFDPYTIPEPAEVYLDVEEFARILGRCKSKGEMIRIIFDESVVTIKCVNSGKVFRTTQIEENPIPSLPVLEFDVDYQIEPSEIDDFVKDLDTVGSASFSFITDDYRLSVVSRDTLSSEYNKCLGVCDSSINLKANFSLERMQDVLLFKKMSKDAILHLKDEHPMKLDFVNFDFKVDCIVAPMLDQE